MEQKYQYNTVEEAIRDLQDGKIILVTDDPDRENEGEMCIRDSWNFSQVMRRKKWKNNAFSQKNQVDFLFCSFR